MARVFSILVCLSALVALTLAQGFDFFGGYSSLMASARDPRANQGPVVFPMTSPGSESSGVRVGASGYGFVPPGYRGGIGPQGTGPNNFYPGFNYW